MRRITIRSLALATLLGLFVVVPVAHAQLRLLEDRYTIVEVTLTPPDPTVLGTYDSPEILALDVPPIPSSGYVLFTSGSGWDIYPTGTSPVRATFMLRYEVTSPALPPGTVLRFGVPLTRLYSDISIGAGQQGGNCSHAEPISRTQFAHLLVLRNPGLTEDAARGIVDELFRRGFHVSMFVRLTSRNISAAIATNPYLDFFAESGSLGSR